MARAVPVAVALALLTVGCGSVGGPLSTATPVVKPGTEYHCTAVSGGFRACTVFALSAKAFHRLGASEVSHIERRDGSRWSVLLSADRAPHPRHGWWRRILAGPRGETLLAQWSGECEVQFTYLITTRSHSLREVFRSQPATALGWTSDGLARVKLLKPIHAAKTRVARTAGIYLVTPSGRVVHRERQLPGARGC